MSTSSLDPSLFSGLAPSPPSYPNSLEAKTIAHERATGKSISRDKLQKIPYKPSRPLSYLDTVSKSNPSSDWRDESSDDGILPDSESTSVTALTFITKEEKEKLLVTLKPKQKSNYDQTVIHRLITNCSWPDAMLATNHPAEKWVSAQSRYLKNREYFDTLIINVRERTAARLQVSTIYAKETCSVRISEYLDYIRTQQGIPKLADIQYFKAEKEMISVLERYIAVYGLLSSDTNPFEESSTTITLS